MGNRLRVGAPTASDRIIAGRYRLIERLGSGGMGTVWRAQDELLHRQVAAKVVFPPTGVTAEERAKLRQLTLREARTAARLSHPNVVTIYDVAEDDGQPWIIMELVKARSLREVVDENGPLDPPAAAKVGLQVLDALRAAHALGIMHRDVKPGNVLIDTGGRAVLADFGIARAQDSPATTTTSGVVVGSPSYIAPERARGERGGPGSDLWSLGATLYAAVEGRPPYDRGGALATLMAVVSQNPDPPRRAGLTWPVISGLLTADPGRRLGSAAAEKMLRRVAGPGAGRATAPMPAAGQFAGADQAGADHADPPDTLKRAERTRAFRPPASPVPEPAAQPARRPGLSPPATSREPGQPARVSVAAPAGTGQDKAAAPAAGFSVLRDPLLPGPGPPSTPGPAEGTPPAGEPARGPGPDGEPGLRPAMTCGTTAPARPSGLPAPRRGETTRLRRTRVVAAAIALVAVAAAALGWYLADRSPAGSSASGRVGHSSAPANPGHSSAGSANPGAAPSGSPRSRGRAAPATSLQPRSAPPTAKTTVPPGAGNQAAVPAGYHRYHDPTGFSLAVPDGWSVSHQGGYVYLTQPSGASFLLIDQSDHPKPDPLANWQQQEAHRRATYAGYQRIRLVAIHYPQAEKAADWEFTYYRSGILTHVLNRNVLANARHAYALYWSTPQDQWASEHHIFAVLARTFQPAA